jgi:hypothetical protein
MQAVVPMMNHQFYETASMIAGSTKKIKELSNPFLMDLISFDRHRVNVALTHFEFELFRRHVEDTAERHHDILLDHPELLAAFRDIQAQIRFAGEEGFLDD